MKRYQRLTVGFIVLGLIILSFVRPLLRAPEPRIIYVEVLPSIPRIQEILGIEPDGIIGPIFIKSLYAHDKEKQREEGNAHAEEHFK